MPDGTNFRKVIFEETKLQDFVFFGNLTNLKLLVHRHLKLDFLKIEISTRDIPL